MRGNYDAETEEQLDQWVAAKREKNFATADAIRAELRIKGIDPDTVRPPGHDIIIDEDIERQLDLWVEAKRAKDFATADAIRADLRAKRIEPDVVRPPGYDTVIDEDIEWKLDRWVEAKRAKDFGLADQLRKELRDKGIEPDSVRPPGYISPSDKETERKLDLWVEAKRMKDFATADAIRADLRTKGIEPDAVRPPGYVPPSQHQQLSFPMSHSPAVQVPRFDPPPVPRFDQGMKKFDTFTEAQLDRWIEAKRNKDFTVADAIRSELRRKGIEPDEVRPASRDFQPTPMHSSGGSSHNSNNNSAALAAAASLVAPLVDAISGALQERGLGAEHLQPLAQDLRTTVMPAIAQQVTQQVMNQLAAHPHGMQPLRAPRALASQQGPASLPPRTFASMAQKPAMGSSSKTHDFQTQMQLDQWVEAKRARDFKLADEIRTQLRLKGIDPDSARPPSRLQDEPMAKRFRS